MKQPKEFSWCIEVTDIINAVKGKDGFKIERAANGRAFASGIGWEWFNQVEQKVQGIRARRAAPGASSERKDPWGNVLEVKVKA